MLEMSVSKEGCEVFPLLATLINGLSGKSWNEAEYKYFLNCQNVLHNLFIIK